MAISSSNDERIALVIEASKRTDAVQQVAAEVQQVARITQTASAQASASVKAQAEAERKELDQLIRMLAMRGRFVDATQRATIEGWHQEQQALVQLANTVGASEEQWLRLALVTQTVERRATAQQAAQQRAADAAALAIERQVDADLRRAAAEIAAEERSAAAKAKAEAAAVARADREAAAAKRAAEAQETAQQRAAAAAERRAEREARAQQRIEVATARANANLGGVPADKLQRGATALRDIAFAADQAKLGGKEATAAFGNLASSLAFIGGSATFAAWASGIGAAVTVATTLVSLFQQASKELKAQDSFVTRLERWNLDAAEAQLAALDAAMMRLQAAAVEKQGNFTDWVRGLRTQEQVAYEQALANREALFKRVSQLRQEDAKDQRARLRDSAQQFQQENEAIGEQIRREAKARFNVLFRQDDIRAQSETARMEAELALQARERQVAAAYVQYDADGKLLELTSSQRQQQAALLRQARELYDVTLARIDAEEAERQRRGTKAARESLVAIDPTLAGGEHDVKLRQIEEEKRLRIAAGAEINAAEAEAEAKRRALYEDGYRRIGASAGRLSQLLINTKSRELRVIGQAIGVAQRLEQAHEAWKALKQSKFYGAKALGLLAEQKYPQAALAAASAVEFAAAAAEAGLNAAGAGGSRGGGGGGSTGNDIAGPAFTPNGSGGAGGTTIYLVTKDPFGRETIAQTIYETDRAQVLKVPIPTTSGVTVMGNR